MIEMFNEIVPLMQSGADYEYHQAGWYIWRWTIKPIVYIGLFLMVFGPIVEALNGD